MNAFIPEATITDFWSYFVKDRMKRELQPGEVLVKVGRISKDDADPRIRFNEILDNLNVPKEQRHSTVTVLLAIVSEEQAALIKLALP